MEESSWVRECSPSHPTPAPPPHTQPAYLLELGSCFFKYWKLRTSQLGFCAVPMWPNFKKLLNLTFLLPSPSSVLISLNFSILLSWIILLEQWLISKWPWTQWWWTSSANHSKCIKCIGKETMISECLPSCLLTSFQTPSTLRTNCKTELPVCVDLSGLSSAWQPSFSRWLGLSVTRPCIFS